MAIDDFLVGEEDDAVAWASALIDVDVGRSLEMEDAPVGRDGESAYMANIAPFFFVTGMASHLGLRGWGRGDCQG